MEKLSQTHDIPNLQNIMFEKFLLEINYILNNGFDGKDKETLKNKFIDFFETSSEIDYSKRLLEAYDFFNIWLGGDDGDKINKADSFCMPILRVMAEKYLEFSKRNCQPDNLAIFKKLVDGIIC